MLAPLLLSARDRATRHPKLTMLLAGALSATGFEPLNLWPLTLACFALLIHCVATARDWRQGAWLGWLFAVGHFTIGLNWIATAFTFQAAMPVWLGWIAVVLLSLYLAVFPAIGIGLTRRFFVRDRPVAFLFAFSALWIVTEWLRSWVFTGFAWNPLGVIAVPIAFPARLFGTYGLSGLCILAAGVIWLIAIGERRQGLIGAVVIVVFAIGSATALRLPLPTPATGPRITLVQPNIAQDEKLTIEGETRSIRKLAPLSLPNGRGPRLLLWPEAAVPDYLDSGYPARYYDYTMGQSAVVARMQLASLLATGDMLVTGVTRLEVRDGQAVGGRNSVTALDSDARLHGTYDKAHLVPYGEYLPMKGLLSAIGLSRLVPGDLEFWPGPGARTIDLGGFGKMGVQICYEIVFSGQVVDHSHRPDYLFNPSNDAWFGAWGPPQHLAQARLRGIEEGLPVLRATTNGVSAVVDPDGRILGMVARHRAGRIDLTLPTARAATPFARLGNIAALLFALLLGLVAIALRTKRSYGAI